MGSIMHLIILAAFLTIGLTDAAEQHWGYPAATDSDEFPAWGGLCDTGTLQSPINLRLKAALKGIFGRLDFENYASAQHNVQIVNNGHTIQLSGFPITMRMAGGPLASDYVVEQIHVHWWSEHTIDNVRYPLEVHIVHRNKRYANITTAVNHLDGLAVLAVLYHVAAEMNPAIAAIVDHLDAVKSYKRLNLPTTMTTFTVRDLFPRIDGYMTYSGSLTTPSCAEVVQWIVLRQTFPVTLEQVQKFKEIEYEQNKQLINNYRFIQKAYNRAVVMVTSSDSDGDDDNDDDDDDDDDNQVYDAAGQQSVLTPLLTLVLTALFAKLLQ